MIAVRARPPGSDTLEERFWAKVDQHGPVPAHRPDLGPCWLWTAGTNARGYGRIQAGGRDDGPVLAHRLAWLLLIGPIPEGLEPDHLCRVPSCVKATADQHGPAHLELVSHRENVLRGDSVVAQRARAETCPKGHPYDQANTRIRVDGSRLCRTCQREYERASYRARRAQQQGGDGS